MSLNEKGKNLLTILLVLFVFFLLPGLFVNYEPITSLVILVTITILLLIFGSIFINILRYPSKSKFSNRLSSNSQFTNNLGGKIRKRYKNIYQSGDIQRVLIEFIIWLAVGIF